jgi:hypothetical protein
MSGTTEDNLGRRLFQVQKEKAVEEALEKIRHRIGAEWNSVSVQESEIFKDVLGEAWTSIDRHRWGTYSFSKLSIEDVYALISLGKKLKTSYSVTEDKIREMDSILSRTT